MTGDRQVTIGWPNCPTEHGSLDTKSQSPTLWTQLARNNPSVILFPRNSYPTTRVLGCRTISKPPPRSIIKDAQRVPLGSSRRYFHISRSGPRHHVTVDYEISSITTTMAGEQASETMSSHTHELIRVTVRRTAPMSDEELPLLELDVSPSQTVRETKRQVQELDGSIAVDNLLLDGAPVEDELPLSSLSSFSSFSSPSSPTLIFTAERRTLAVSATAVGQPKRRKRCSFHGCTSMPLRGVGDCSNCDGRYCSRHRLMEQHECQGLQGCKQQLHERNALKLQQQQTVPNKV